MAAPFTTEVSFEEYLPLIDIIVRELTLTTGMVVACQAAGVAGGLWRLSNQKAAMEIDLMPYVEATQERMYLIASDPFNRWNPYLHETLVVRAAKTWWEIEGPVRSVGWSAVACCSKRLESEILNGI